MAKNYTLVFASEHKETFESIRTGKKKIETCAASFKYRNIKAGDTVTLSCDGEKFQKDVIQVTHFKTLDALFAVFKPSQIKPGAESIEEMVRMYHDFPDYEEKIARFGILAIELK